MFRTAEYARSTGTSIIIGVPRLLEGDFEDYNFGAAADLLFIHNTPTRTECALPDDRYEELTLSPIVEDVAELTNSLNHQVQSSQHLGAVCACRKQGERG